MTNFKVVYSDVAIDDLHALSHYIIENCKAPITSREYAKGIVTTINSLSYLADSLPLFRRKSFAKYGFNVRRINYKKMAIIYSIHGKVVLIQRIIPGALIIEME